MRPFSRTIITAILGVVLSIAVAGCSGDNNPSPGDSTTVPVGS
ncbi:MAG TPA: hypothetical protein VFY15_02195 [Acidimicrobiia bacterium]|nr:hypothetical protein [Acidimicrobiia bacterium]